MELRHLRYFCAVADCKGYSQAARRLHVAQSSVSEQVRDLEREIGVPLLCRDGREVRLTAHGEVFLEEAKEILAHVHRAVEMAQRSLRGEAGTLSIGFMVAATAPFFPQIIREYRNHFPGVRLSLFEMGPVRQMEALAEREIDIGFTRSLEPPFDNALRSECLYNDPILAVLPQSHKLASGAVPIEALAEERFILYDREAWPGLFDTIIGLCRKAGFSPQVTNSALVQTILTLVGAGEGVTLLPASLRYYRPEGLVFCPVAPESPEVSLVMAWRPDQERAVVHEFLELVRAKKPDIQTMMRGHS